MLSLFEAAQNFGLIVNYPLNLMKFSISIELADFAMSVGKVEALLTL